MPSAGCGMSTSQMLGRWVESTVMPSGASRPYSVYLPTGYDPMRAYPVVVLLHGCGSGTNNLPMERETGSGAILIRGTGSAADTCWTTTSNGADVAFFDAMVADVKARFCTDAGRFFAVGYSSGSWLANQLGCIRTSVLRGLATVAGGNPGVRNCGGPIAQIFVHDQDDMSNVISGGESARDRLLTQNGCDEAAAPVAEDPSPCVRYQGCDPGYPVVWCETSGEGHNRQDNLAAPAFWDFFQEL
jgi:polyhydroxybutyrate depolymerase